MFEMPKARRDIPLVLPHALLSIGLLLFAILGEQPAPSAPQGGIQAAVATISAAQPGASGRRI